MTQAILTQSRLKELLHYDPDTGVFTWIVSRSGVSGKYSVAGAMSVTKYIAIRVDHHLYKAHRLAFLYMDGEFPHEDVDHINHIRHDNRFENIRKVARSENTKNMSMYKSNTSGVTGVTWFKRDSKWKAQISVNGKLKHLGYFNDKLKAIAARQLADVEFGYHRNHGG